MPAAIVVVFLVIVVAVVAGQVSKTRRRDALLTAGRALGLDPLDDVPFDLAQLGFHLLAQGDGSDHGNVLGGVWQGLSVYEMDYEYYDVTTDSEGRTSRSYHRFSLVLAGLPAAVPFVRIEPETIMTRLADHLAMRDIEFESEDFNRTYNVTSPQREFAFKLIDARTMEYLLGPGKGVSYEVGGPWALVFTHRLEPSAVAGLLGQAKGFVDHIPRLVWDDYGKAAT